MSNLEDSFLEAIARQPHDWLPRLIFADWLEEQGDPRGELIRLSHQLTRLDCEARQRKEARLQELMRAGVIWPSPPLPNSLGMPFVLIPPGQFRMGSPSEEPDRFDNEILMEVTLTQGFWLGQYAVTQAEYQAVMGKNPSQFDPVRLQTDSSQYPVEQVIWAEALDFCQKLTTQERAAERLPVGWQYTLPTEAQWEYACRAGTTTATAFGDKLDSTQANFDGNYPYNGADKGEYKHQTTAVGSYRANAWNLHDMHGNVCERCRDGYVDQPPGGSDPEVIDTVADRVRRGGFWNSWGVFCRSASRGRASPDTRYGMGLRLAAVQDH